MLNRLSVSTLEKIYGELYDERQTVYEDTIRTAGELLHTIGNEQPEKALELNQKVQQGLQEIQKLAIELEVVRQEINR